MNHLYCLRSERDKLFYVWSRGSYSLYNAMKVKKFAEKKLTRLAFRHFVYLVISSAITPQKVSSKFCTMKIHFVDSLYFFLSIVSAT